MNKLDLNETLNLKIMKLSQHIWENKVDAHKIESWLANFKEGDKPENSEQTHALYLLSNFMFFGVREVRAMLKSMYRDKVLNPLTQQVRKELNHTREKLMIDLRVRDEIESTRFLGIGNPSESGTHLLYFFRQENKLSKDDFIHSHEIIEISKEYEGSEGATISLKDANIKRYVFIDDLCGSGDQAVQYSKKLLTQLKELNPELDLHYITLFATSDGMDNIRKNTVFDKVECVFELDETYKCFSDESRYFPNNSDLPLDKNFAKGFILDYGVNTLFYADDEALGYNDGQLLLGFSHNTPDNTLPIFHEEHNNWFPIFKRYPKQ